MKKTLALLTISLCCTTTVLASDQSSQDPAISHIAEEGTLKVVMQHLGQDYAALNQAILVEDFEQAAQSAHKIAYHDEPSMWQKMKIMGSLRTEVPDFKKTDEKVHQLALNIEKEAKAKNMNGLIQQQSNMLSACMSCHSTYRQRIIKILQ
ncbi:MAG: cytochrome c [Zetaproteobacteria bacterium]|nr:cytochrome c [Zetaproteobacteria bacterium]